MSRANEHGDLVWFELDGQRTHSWMPRGDLEKTAVLNFVERGVGKLASEKRSDLVPD